ncbi:MAG: hypothetical protein LBQ81_00725 [Zoogloeaceae bacterium]|jgi:hypothetical protein|nr:hypothetical protein [Zoogloeaceae bacterium]
MKKHFPARLSLAAGFLAATICTAAFSQTFTGYSGFIGEQPVEFMLEDNGVTFDSVLYMYAKYNIPIYAPRVDDALKFHEQGSGALLNFSEFNRANGTLEGEWTDASKTETIKISLRKTPDESGDILQANSTKEHYFRITPLEGCTSKVKVFDKKTNALLQVVEGSGEGCGRPGFHVVGVDDYNFDGIDDFSAFAEYFSGSNSIREYFLFDTKTKKYSSSEIRGISLEFDHENKIIHETNSCCMGTIVSKKEYKVVNNKMALVKKQCFKWDEKKRKLIERNKSTCE